MQSAREVKFYCHQNRTKNLNIIKHNGLSILYISLLLIHGFLCRLKLLGIRIYSKVWAIFVLIFLSHVSSRRSGSFILLLLANTRQNVRASKSLSQQRLLCIMMWFVDELLHNLWNERMNCCLIYVHVWMTTVCICYWTELDLSTWSLNNCCVEPLFSYDPSWSLSPSQK